MQKFSSTLRLSLLALSAASWSAAAAPEFTASATASNFSYTLIDLNPYDGIAPTLSMNNESLAGSSQNGGIQHLGGAPTSSNYQWLSGAGSASIVNAQGWSTVDMGSLASSSNVHGASAGNFYFTSTSDHIFNFTLSANTLAIFSTSATVAVGPSEYGISLAQAKVEMSGRMWDRNDDGAINNAIFTETLSTFDQSQDSNSLFGVLHTGDHSTRGRLELTTYAHGETVIAVPEPSSYAMLVAGLGLVGALARRQRRNRA